MYRINFSRRYLMLTTAMVLGFSVIGAPFSWAEITSLTALSSKDIGPFNDKPYREIEARLEGSAPGGAYAVPITLVLPARAEDHNGFAVVDIINTITIGKPQFVVGGAPLPLARGHMGDEFLFGRGNAYVGVMWDKTATDTLKTGTIAAAADGYTIIKDAAALARDPAKFLPADAGPAPSSSKLVAYGYSQTGSLLRGCTSISTTARMGHWFSMVAWLPAPRAAAATFRHRNGRSARVRLPAAAKSSASRPRAMPNGAAISSAVRPTITGSWRSQGCRTFRCPPPISARLGCRSRTSLISGPLSARPSSTCRNG
jgi:hypothetical protein